MPRATALAQATATYELLQAKRGWGRAVLSLLYSQFRNMFTTFTYSLQRTTRGHSWLCTIIFFLPVASLPAQVSITAIMAILHFILAKCHTQQVLQHTSWFISKSGQHCRVASSKVAKKVFQTFNRIVALPRNGGTVHTPRWTTRRGYFGSLCFQWDPYSMVKRLRQET